MIDLEDLVYRSGDLWLESRWDKLLELCREKPLDKNKVYRAAMSLFQNLVDHDNDNDIDIAELCRNTVEYLTQ